MIGPMVGLAFFGNSSKRMLGSIGWMMALWGVGYVLVGLAPSLFLASAAVWLAHMGGGAQFTFSTYGLQDLMPDNVRGRVFALDFAAFTLATAVSALIVGGLAEVLSIRALFIGLGLIAIVFGSTWTAITHSYWDDLEPSATE